MPTSTTTSTTPRASCTSTITTCRRYGATTCTIATSAAATPRVAASATRIGAGGDSAGSRPSWRLHEGILEAGSWHRVGATRRLASDATAGQLVLVVGSARLKPSSRPYHLLHNTAKQ